MRYFQKTFILLIALLTFKAEAFTPESGFWWNPDESGSGYSIEIQDNYIFVALYVYDEFGNPTWYSAGGFLQGNALFGGDLSYSSGGPCIDCSYSQPITVVGQDGPITINFSTEITGTIKFNGAVKNIERFNFLLGDETSRLLGEWQTIIDFSSVDDGYPYSGDVLIFDQLNTVNGDRLAEGCRPDNSVDGKCSNYALDFQDTAAIYDIQNNEIVVVVNHSDNYWLAYYLKMGLNQFDGEAELYKKSTGNNNVYFPVRGFKTASKSFIQTGNGPSKSAALNTNKAAPTNKYNFNIKAKSLHDFTQAKQDLINKRQQISQALISKLTK